MIYTILMTICFGTGIGLLISPAFRPEMALYNLSGFGIIFIGLLIAKFSNWPAGKIKR